MDIRDIVGLSPTARPDCNASASRRGVWNRRSAGIVAASALALLIGLHPAQPALADSAAASAAAGRPALYTPEGDPMFAEPYIDIDEWRDAPVRHRYVHGGFKGTNTRFSFYFPPKEQYEGRFYQHVTPVPDSENLAQANSLGEENKIGFAIASGAYFVETNGGGEIDLTKSSLALADPTITAYRANAAAAHYSRTLARQMYGGKRPYGYVYGGSGGSYRTIGSVENTTGVWDGSVPYVIGSTMSIPNQFTVRMHAMRLLWDKFPQIVDAVEPGGSGDPYKGLSVEEAAALREVTRMGFPMQSWFGYKTMGIHGFAALYPGIVAADPTYFTDFWTKPGYLGHDNPGTFDGDRLQHKTAIAAPVTAAEAARLGIVVRLAGSPKKGKDVDNSFDKLHDAEGRQIVGFRLSSPPPDVNFLGGDLIVDTGGAKGEKLMLTRIVGDIAVLGVVNPRIANQLTAGDEVQVDNSRFLAAQTYHRHQVPGPEFTAWNQFRGPDGKPIYPQRPMLLGPQFVKSTAGSLQTGRIQGKMIIVEGLWDREGMPWQGDWYRDHVVEHLGAETDENLRMWFIDHALHGDSSRQEDPTRTVSYLGALHQALRDVAAWAEKGIEPPKSTAYRIVDDAQVAVPANARDRLGIQPVVTLTSNGVERVEVRPGQAVTFTGTIEVPPAAGSIVAAEWDFDGAGKFTTSSQIPTGATRVTVTKSYRFDRPGTYFPALRAVSQRQGDATTPYARIQNLGRMRVVVK